MPAQDTERTGKARRPARKPAPRRVSTQAFSRSLGVPGSGIPAAARRAERRQGEALARTPGVKARLTPAPAATTPAAQKRVVQRMVAAKRAAGLSPQQTRAVSRSSSPAGEALRQAQRSQGVGSRRVYRETAVQEIRRSQGLPPYSPATLRRLRFDQVSREDRAGLEQAGRKIVERTNRPAKEGRPHAKLKVAGLGSIDLTTTVAAAKRRVLAGHGSGLKNVAAFAGRTADDARNFPRDAVKSAYEQGAAVVEAAQGDTRRAKRVLKGYAEGVIGTAVKGDVKGALRKFGEHPGYGALELSGAYSVAGRGAGALARSGALGRAAKRAGATARSDLQLAPGISVPRRYSKNLVTASAQKAKDRRLAERAKALGEDEYRRARARGVGEKEARLVQRRAEHDAGPNAARDSKLPFRGREHLLRKHADEFNSSVTEATRRVGRERARAEAKRIVPTRGDYNLATRRGRLAAAIDRGAGRPKMTVRGRVVTTRPETGVMQVVVEQARRKGDVRSVLQREKDRLSAVYRNERATMSKRAQEKNRAQVAALDAFLKHPDSQKRIDRLWDATHRYDAAMKPRTAKLVDLKAMTAGQAKNAVLRPLAVGELGGRYDARKRVLPEDSAKHRAAKGKARTSAARVTALKGETAKAARAAERLSARPAARAERQSPRRAVWLHGTERGFEGLPSVQRAGSSEGLHVTSSPAVAEKYAGVRGSAAEPAGGRVVPLRLKDGNRIVDLRPGSPAPGALKALAAAERSVADPRVAARVRDVAARIERDGALTRETMADAVSALRAAGEDVSKAQGAGGLGKVLDDAGFAGLRHEHDGGDAMIVTRDGAMESPYAAGAAARGRVTELRQARKDAQKAARADAVAASRARPRAKTVGLVDADGTRLTPKEIDRRLAADPRPVERSPAFVGQSDRNQGARAAFVNFWEGRREPGGHRTGDATALYGGDPNPAAMMDSIVRAQGMIDAVEGWDKFIGRYSYGGPDGKGMTVEQATKLIEDQPDGGLELAIVREAPAKYDPARLHQIESALQQGLPLPEEFYAGLISDRFKNALVKPGELVDGAETVRVVSKVIYERMRDHQTRAAGPLAKTMQKFTATFRGVVLPFSTKWLTGNVLEAALRLAAEGSIPGVDAMIGRRLLKTMFEMDAAKAAEWETRTTGGLLFGSADNMSIYRDHTAFAGTGLESLGRGGHVLAQLPPIRMTLRGFDAYRSMVFGLNKGMENFAIEHAIGKLARREIQDMSGSWIRSLTLGKGALDDLARGMLDTNKQAAFARSIDDVLGQYSRFSPEVKAVINTVAPFLPWYLNAAKFVYYTLPAKHPVKTALLARTADTFEEDWATDNSDVPPGDLRSAIRTADGGFLNISRYTPFGAFTGEAPGFLLDPFLPQFASAWEVAHGRSWTGRPLELQGAKRGDRTTASQRAWLAFYSIVESTFPGVQLARRLQEGGETAFDDSTVFAPKTKKGTSYGSSAVRRVADPFRPTYLRKPKGGGGVGVLPAAPVARGPVDPIDAVREELARAQRDVTADPAIDEIREQLAAQGG